MKTTTTYQKNVDQAKTITRRMEYDHTGRLLKTYHQLDSAAEILLAENQYNELGQLITKKLHSENGSTFKQHVDYRYNIRGWLTRINNADLTPDNQNELRDYFGMELAYNNDIGVGSFIPQYDKNIAAIKWSTNLGLGFNDIDLGISEPTQRAYKFEYDPMKRLTNSTHAEKTTGWNTSTAYHEDGIEYDLNGNIQKLNRTGKGGFNMDILDYSYSGNQLLKVDDIGNTTEGFKDGNTTGDDYTYDVNGSIASDKNKGITQIVYNHMNLPVQIIKNTGEYVKFIYDGGGRKLSQEVYSASNELQKKIDYVGEFVYQNDTLQFLHTEEGRINMLEGAPIYDYILKDHLGYGRVTFTTRNKSETFTATLEDNTQAQEQNDFNNYSRITNDLLDHTDSGTTYDKVLLLNGGYNGQIGLAKNFAVVPGDTIKASVHAKYIGTTNGPSNLANFATALTSAFGLTPGMPGEAGTAYQALNGYGAMIAAGSRSDNDNWPKGFLNILVFSKDFDLIDMSYQQLDGAYVQSGGTKAQHQLLSGELVIRQAGYVYVFLSNEGVAEQQIGFDDYTITHVHSAVIQQDEYYSYGMPLATSYQREGELENRWRYGNKEQIEDLDLGLIDFGARLYMSDIGRWGVLDPLADQMRRHSPYNYAFDNPVRFIDPDGMKPDDVILKGSEKDKAFEQLKAAVNGEMTLSMNDKGLVTYTQNDPDAELSSNAQQLANAIDDHSVQVQLTANTKEQSPDGGEIIGGAYLGAKNVESKDGDKITVAHQQLNTNHAEKLDNYFETPGATVLHEVTESYHGAKLVQRTGINVTDPSSLSGHQALHISHKKATPPPPLTITAYDYDGNVMKDGNFPARVEYSMKAPGKKKEVLRSILLGY